MKKNASTPTIRRLPHYLKVIRDLKAVGHRVVSGTVIAEELDLEPIQVRKDLAVTGIIGKPRVGYVIDDLEQSLVHFLNWDREHHSVLIGAGYLGHALLGYRVLKNHGLKIIAAFDNEPDKVGQSIFNTPVLPVSQLPSFLEENRVSIGILTVPAEAAREMADILTEGGVNAIWNFTQAKLKLPTHVTVQRDDLSSGFALLSIDD